MQRIPHTIIIAIILLCMPSTVVVMTANAQRLFHFERSKNANIICYDVRLKDGHLDAKDPVHAYWKLLAEQGQEEELSFLQRKIAFGHKTLNASATEATIVLTASDRVKIHITRHQGKWVALCTINGQQARLTKMYAQMKSPNSMKCLYVDVHGISLKTGKPITERLTQ